MKKMIETFFQSEDFQRLSVKTKDDYKLILKKFGEEFDFIPNTNQVLEYLERKHKYNSFSTFNHNRRYLRAFFQRFKKEGVIEENPIDKISFKKPNRAKGEVDPSKVPRSITRDQLKLLINRFRLVDYQGYLVLCLLAESGCRIGEALQVKKNELKSNYIYLPITKTGSPRYLCFSSELGIKLLTYSNSHPSCWVFPSPNDLNKHITYDYFHSAFDKLRKGIVVSTTGKPVTIHGIRHTFASERVGLVDPLELKELMGHQSIQTTLRYISISKEKILNAYEKTKHLSVSA